MGEVQLKEQQVCCGLGGYNVCFSRTKHGFESRQRNLGGGTAQGATKHFSYEVSEQQEKVVQNLSWESQVSIAQIGQSARLLNGRSQVQLLLGTRFHFFHEVFRVAREKWSKILSWERCSSRSKYHFSLALATLKLMKSVLVEIAQTGERGLYTAEATGSIPVLDIPLFQRSL